LRTNVLRTKRGGLTPGAGSPGGHRLTELATAEGEGNELRCSRRHRIVVVSSSCPRPSRCSPVSARRHLPAGALSAPKGRTVHHHSTSTAWCVDLRTIPSTFRQEVITKDNAPAKVNAVAYFRVVGLKAVVEVQNIAATSQIARPRCEASSASPTWTTCSPNGTS
jgi:hypothetical protein